MNLQPSPTLSSQPAFAGWLAVPMMIGSTHYRSTNVAKRNGRTPQGCFSMTD